MTTSDNSISVNVLGKSYKVKCPPESARELQQSAEYVNQQMKRLELAGNITTTDNIAVVAALNICNELMELKKQKNQYIDTMHERIQSLQKRIENFLELKEEVAV